VEEVVGEAADAVDAAIAAPLLRGHGHGRCGGDPDDA